MNAAHEPGERGFSLVELMISMVLGLILVGGIMTMYLSSKRTLYTTEASSQIQETARFALDRIGFDVRMSGFWGCESGTEHLNSALNASAGLLDFTTSAILGTDNDGFNDSDSVTIAMADAQTVELQTTMSSSAASLDVGTTSGLQQGDIVVVNDCKSADLFQVDGAHPHVSGALLHDADGAMVPGNLQSSLSKPYQAGAEIFRVEQATWSVGTDTDGQPALLRNGTPLIRGVEDIQFAYGIDSNADGSTDRYLDADDVVDWALVKNIKLGLLIRSEREVLDQTPPAITFWGSTFTPNDGYMRRGITAVISIRNRLS